MSYFPSPLTGQHQMTGGGQHQQHQITPMAVTTNPVISPVATTLTTLPSTSYMYAGVFRDERVLQLMHILTNLSESVFLKMHEVSNEGNVDITTYASRFCRCLESLVNWKSQMRTDVANSAVDQYPELIALYRYTVVLYLKELYKNEKAATIPVTIPPFPDFLHTYYSTLAVSSCMKQLKFFHVYGMDRTHLHMEALRQTLMQSTRSVTYDMVTIQQQQPIAPKTNVQPPPAPQSEISNWKTARVFEQQYSQVPVLKPDVLLQQQPPPRSSLLEKATQKELNAPQTFSSKKPPRAPQTSSKPTAPQTSSKPTAPQTSSGEKKPPTPRTHSKPRTPCVPRTQSKQPAAPLSFKPGSCPPTPRTCPPTPKSTRSTKSDIEISTSFNKAPASALRTPKSKSRKESIPKPPNSSTTKKDQSPIVAATIPKPPGSTSIPKPPSSTSIPKPPNSKRKDTKELSSSDSDTDHDGDTINLDLDHLDPPPNDKNATTIQPPAFF